MNDIRMEHIDKRFGPKTVLRDFSARFPIGQATCIMGSSGCGKTTLLRVLLGLEQPDAGRILGRPERMGAVFQEDRLLEGFSPLANIRLVTGRKISPNTVNDYVEALTESFLFYPADRFNIVGKQLLKVNKKLYIVDLGLRGHILPRQNYDLGFSLENLVYFELLRRGYRVMIGKIGSTEVDFVAEKQGAYTYIQVTADMTAEATFTREMRPLTLIRDNYEKIILTADRLTLGNYNGIQVKNLIDWLLGEDV